MAVTDKFVVVESTPISHLGRHMNWNTYRLRNTLYNTYDDASTAVLRVAKLGWNHIVSAHVTINICLWPSRQVPYQHQIILIFLGRLYQSSAMGFTNISLALSASMVTNHCVHNLNTLGLWNNGSSKYSCYCYALLGSAQPTYDSWNINTWKALIYNPRKFSHGCLCICLYRDV